jgi:hypothetical protein
MCHCCGLNVSDKSAQRCGARKRTTFESVKSGTATLRNHYHKTELRHVNLYCPALPAPSAVSPVPNQRGDEYELCANEMQ